MLIMMTMMLNKRSETVTLMLTCDFSVAGGVSSGSIFSVLSKQCSCSYCCCKSYSDSASL